ncbi:hypothetical protein D3C76_1282650 [compost metagenome]
MEGNPLDLDNVTPSSIVLIDGMCFLCQGATKFIIRNDPAGRFHFASLQSVLGQKLLSERGVPMESMNTFVLIEDGHYYTRSTAALRIAKYLRGLWPLTYVLILIPNVIRDTVYQYIAKNRYRWFGKSDQCMLPTPELKGKWLE